MIIFDFDMYIHTYVHNFHSTVSIAQWWMGKSILSLWNFTDAILFAKIPSNQRFTEELYFELVWRKKFVWQWISRLFSFHTVIRILLVKSERLIFMRTWFHEISVKFCTFVQIYYSTLWKNEKFSLAEKKFRQIDSLVISF